MRRRVLVMGGIADVLEPARMLDIETVFFQHAEGMSPRTRRLADECHEVSFDDHEEVLSRAERIYQDRPYDCVISFTEPAMIPAAMVGERLGLPGASTLTTARMLKDKVAMRDMLSSAGLSPVRSALVTSVDEAGKLAEEAGYPLILKPRDGTGSLNVRRVDSAETLPAALRAALSSDSRGCLLEEFLAGPEFSVEGFSFHGIHRVVAVTEKHVTGNFVESGHVVPADMTPGEHAAVCDLVRKFLDLAGVTDGPSHTEVIITDRGPRIVESHDRLGGDQIFRLVELAYGANMLSWCYSWPLGMMTVPSPPAARAAACIRFLLPPPGRVVRVSVLDAVREDASLDRLELGISAGDHVQPLGCSLDRAGYVLVQAANREAAIVKAERLAAGVEIETEPVQELAGSAQGRWIPMAETRASGRSAWRGTFRQTNPRRLLIMSFIDSLGTGLYLAGSVIFFTQKVKLSAAEVGLGLSIASVVGLAGVMPSGWVAQRLGTWQTLLVFDIWRTIGFSSYVFIHSFPWFLVAVCALSIPEQAFNPLTQHLVEQVVGSGNRVMMMGKIRTVYNIGFAISVPLSGLAVKVGTTAGYDSLMLGDALTYVVAGILLWRLRGASSAARQAEVSQLPKGRRFSVDALRDRSYRNAAAINSIMSLHLSILSIGIPLWITQHTHVPRYAVGPLLVINAVLVILLQVPISSLAKTVDKSLMLIRAAGLALAACCVLLAVAAKLPLALGVAALAGAVAFLTLAEMAQSSGGWTLAYELAPTAARAEALTTFGLGISAQFVVGPVLLSDAVIAHGSSGWVVLGAVFLLLTLVTPVMIRSSRARTGTEIPVRKSG